MATYLDKSDEELKALVRKRDELKKEIEHQRKVKKIQDEVDELQDELDVLKGKKKSKKEKEDIKKDWLEDFLKKIERKDPCPYEPKPWIVPQLPGEPLIYKVTCSE